MSLSEALHLILMSPYMACFNQHLRLSDSFGTYCNCFWLINLFLYLVMYIVFLIFFMHNLLFDLSDELRSVDCPCVSIKRL